MTKPSILLVPGAGGLPTLYDGIVSAVAALGYEIKAAHLPTVGLGAGVGREGVPPTVYDDAALLAREVERLADEGKDVVVVAHSYGGIPASECARKGLGREDRQKRGKEGGLVRIAYMTCLVPPIGGTAADLLAEVASEQQGKQPPGEVSPEQQGELLPAENGWSYNPDHALVAAYSFSDVSPEVGVEWVKKFAKHSSASFANPLTHAGYKDFPVSYLVCEDDLVIPARIQRAEIEMIEKESGNKVDVTSIKASHAPVASQPQKVVDWIVRVASST